MTTAVERGITRRVNYREMCDTNGSLSSELQTGLRNIREIHLAGEIRGQGLGTRANPWFSELVITPTVYTADPMRWNTAIYNVAQELAQFSPQIQPTVIYPDGMMQFPSVTIWRADGVRDERMGVLFLPKEGFALNVVRYFNRKGGEDDPDFERRAYMVTPEELGVLMSNHSLHSPEYRSHHST